MTGSSHSAGLRYVISSSTMTTARVPNSSVPSMPLNDFAESAAPPSGPAMCDASPCAFERVIARSLATAAVAAFHPFAPRLTGTTIWAALPSVAKNGPAIWCRTTPGITANLAASLAALLRSAAVRPDGRLYTTTAGNTFGDWKLDSRFSTRVDSAFGGSHACASFFSAPVSLPDNGPATATAIIQNARTAHLVRRPPGNRSRARALLISNPQEAREQQSRSPAPTSHARKTSYISNLCQTSSFNLSEARFGGKEGRPWAFVPTAAPWRCYRRR